MFFYYNVRLFYMDMIQPVCLRNPSPNTHKNEAIDQKSWLGRGVYVHGTNSLVLSTLLRTDFQLLGLDKLLFNYKVVPLSGEIIRGGLEGINARIGVRFGTIVPVTDEHREQKRFYTLEKIIEGYATTDFNKKLPLTIEDLLSYLEHNLNKALQSFGNNIIIMTLILSRLKVLGYDFDNHNNTMTKVLNVYEAAIQKKYLVLLVAKYLTYSKNVGNYDIINYYDEYLENTHINFREIYENSNDRNLNVLVTFMNSFSDENLFELRETLSKTYIEQTIDTTVIPKVIGKKSNRCMCFNEYVIQSVSDD